MQVIGKDHIKSLAPNMRLEEISGLTPNLYSGKMLNNMKLRYEHKSKLVL